MTVLGVRYEGFPLAVFSYHIKYYIVRYYVGIFGQFSLGRFQPFCSVGFPVRLSTQVV